MRRAGAGSSPRVSARNTGSVLNGSSTTSKVTSSLSSLCTLIRSGAHQFTYCGNSVFVYCTNEGSLSSVVLCSRCCCVAGFSSVPVHSARA